MFTLTHLIKISPWPVLTGGARLLIAASLVIWFKFHSFNFVLFSATILILLSFNWWLDVSREGVGGDYTGVVIDGLKFGIILFIFSEICFFAAFFWRFFHSSFTPVAELGNNWPPVGIISFNPFQVPLLNTCVLLRRGATVTWAHHILLGGGRVVVPLVFTCILGVYFSFLQGAEYYIASFSIRDRVYGSVFFIATGFHGIHVLVGTIFLIICFFRLLKNQFTEWNHLGFELAIWYWHFVDVVWLFLFSCIYWWGCSTNFFSLKLNMGNFPLLKW